MRSPFWSIAGHRLRGQASGSGVGGAGGGLVLLDAQLAGSPIEAHVLEWLADEGLAATTERVQGPADLGTAVELAERVKEFSFCVAVGGGTVMDLAKLATLMSHDPRVLGHLTVPQRCGAVVVPMTAARTRPLVAVPTTIGTGSEASSVVVLDHDGRRRLILGTPLSPEAFILDPSATAGLPRRFFAEGMLEILARLVSPYIGATRPAGLQDRLVESLVGELMEAADLVTHSWAAGMEAPPAARLRVATVSTMSHAVWVCRPDEPYAVKSWLLATELSRAACVRKMTAMAALLPEYWTVVCGGDSRFGSADRLDRIWQVIVRNTRLALPQNPAAGIAALVLEWGVGAKVRLDAGLVPAVVESTARAWGYGLPMLGDLQPEDVRGLVAAATASGQCTTTHFRAASVARQTPVTSTTRRR